MTMRGFTLIEIVITVSLIAFLSGLAFPRLLSFSNSQQLEQAALDFKGNLEEARSRSVASLEKDGQKTEWGVRIISSGIYCIGSRREGASDQLSEWRRFYLPSGITLSPISPAPVQTVFKRITGAAFLGARIYTFTQSGVTYTVTVSANGDIN